MKIRYNRPKKIVIPVPSDLRRWSDSKSVVTAANAWLPRCVRYIRQALLSLSDALSDAPEEMHKRLQDLALDLRAHCMSVLFSQATEEIKNLYRQETWRFEEDEEQGAITQLPFLFENIVMETLQLLKDVVMSSKPGETEMFHQRIVQKDATELCTNLLRAFAACLDKAVFEEPNAESSSNIGAGKGGTRGVLPGTPGSRKFDPSSPSRSLPRTPNHAGIMPGRGSREDLLDLDLSGVGNGLAPPPPLDQRVLITLSNMAYTRDHVVPRLVESCSKYGQLSYHEIVNPVYGYDRLNINS